MLRSAPPASASPPGRVPIAQRLRAIATRPDFAIVACVVVGNLLRIFSTVILTRLLDSEAFGVVGIIASVAFTFALLSDVGVFAFVVRRVGDDEPGFMDKVWTVRLVRLCGLTLLMAALSGPISQFLEKPELAIVIAVWSTTFVLEGLTSMAFATAVRRGQVARVSAFELLGNTLQIVIQILLALFFRSYWALIAAMLVGGALKIPLSYWMFPGERRRFLWSNDVAMQMWRFGRYIIGSSIITIGISQIDKVVFAKHMSLGEFGYYSIGATLALAPLGIIAPFANKVLLPGYAKLWLGSVADRKRDFYRMKTGFSLAYLFAAGGLIGSAGFVVALLYDPRYVAVADFLRILAIGSTLAAITYPTEALLVASGRSWTSLAYNVARLVWLAIGGFVALQRSDLMLFIWTVGTAEVSALLLSYTLLARFHVLSVRREALLLAAAAAGGFVGYSVGRIGLQFL